MLSISQKEVVLRKAGVVVLPFPVRRLIFQERFDRSSLSYPVQELEADIELEAAVQEWRKGITALYDAWEGSRALVPRTDPAEAKVLSDQQVLAHKWDADAEKLSRHLHRTHGYPKLTKSELATLCSALEKTLCELKLGTGMLASTSRNPPGPDVATGDHAGEIPSPAPVRN